MPVFIVPFAFILLTAAKTEQEASLLELSWPAQWAFFEKVATVVERRRFLLVRAFINSAILTVAAVAIMVVLGAMVGYVLGRRESRWNPLVNTLVLTGFIIPPAVVPTIWCSKASASSRRSPASSPSTSPFGLPFCVLMFRAFVATIPRERDEAAIIDGAGPVRLFFRVVFPLLRSVVITVIVVRTVFAFNDITYALYFLPGEEHATVQLTTFGYTSQSLNAWNLLFTNVLLITVPRW